MSQTKGTNSKLSLNRYEKPYKKFQRLELSLDYLAKPLSRSFSPSILLVDISEDKGKDHLLRLDVVDKICT